MPDPISPPPLLGQSAEFLATLDQVSGVAAMDRPALIIGERGSGKELIAGRLHFLSPRWSGKYVTVNCAALAEDLLESELFGHESGAFTGASHRHEGRFERANGGTLFLDEIASASLRVQEKILRVVEYGEFERVGGEKPLHCNVRIIGAANMDLPTLARAGRFRADLLDRLAFEVITLPPLRARWEDIPILAQHFATAMAKEMGEDDFSGFGRDGMRVLMEYDWPGNVRELKNTVERAVARLIRQGKSDRPLNEIVLDPFASPWRPQTGEGALKVQAPQAAPPLFKDEKTPFAVQINRLEAQLLRDALETETGHQGRAAKRLGLSYDQLRHYARKHGIKPKKT